MHGEPRSTVNDPAPHRDDELANPELLSDERLGEIVAQCLRKLDALPTVPGTLRLYRNGVTSLIGIEGRRQRFRVGSALPERPAPRCSPAP